MVEDTVEDSDWCLLFKFEDIGQVLVERAMTKDKRHIVKVKVIDKESGYPISKIFKSPDELSSDEERTARDKLFYSINPAWTYVAALEALESLRTQINPNNFGGSCDKGNANNCSS